MLLRCMPLLLLRRGPTYQNFTQLVHRRIGHFMRGEWRILYESTLKEQQMQNEMDANRTPKPNISRKQERALEQARYLNYSRAMNYDHQVPPPNHQMIYVVNSNNYILHKNFNQYHSRKSMYLCLLHHRKVGS